jgi:hypothetical protein
MIINNSAFNRKNNCVCEQWICYFPKIRQKTNTVALRGLEKVEMEFSLTALGHNLRKMAAKIF